MSEQDRAQATTKRRRSRQTSKQNGDLPTSPPQRPAPNDKEAWIAHWEKQGQPWRTEPEIDEERQKYLDGRRSIVPVIEKGIYPFKDIKLNRADVEWLLAIHENGGGPVVWNDETHGLRNEMKESRQMRNIFQSRRGTQASVNRSERFFSSWR